MPLMSRKLSKEKCWVVFALVIYLGFFRSCRAVSLWQRGDVFDGENRDDDFEEARWPSGQQVNRNTNVGQSDVVAPDSADAEAASPYFNVSMLGESDFALINSSWIVGKSRRRGSSGPDYSHEYQAVSTGQRTFTNLFKLYTYGVLYQQTPAILSDAGMKGHRRWVDVLGTAWSNNAKLIYTYFFKLWI